MHPTSTAARALRTFGPTLRNTSVSAAAAGRLAIVTTVIGMAVAACSPPAAPPADRGPAEVGVVTIQPQRQPITTELSGRTRARMIAEIRPQVGGIIQKRLFDEGAKVEAGQALYQIEPAGFEASVASAEASVAKAEATVNSTRATARRSADLVKLNALSKQANEESQAAHKQALADLALAKAALETARINLGYTRITAPISGWIDTSTVSPGALVTANQDMALTTVRQLDPLNVDVTQSSADVLRLKHDLAAGRLKGVSDNEAMIRLTLEDGSLYKHEGRLKFSGVAVNPGTGAVTLRALVPNPEGLLMPGMYVQAVLEEGVVEQAILVPQRGVTRNAAGEASALIVNDQNEVERRDLQIAQAIGNRWLVLGGLAPGDRVIVEGTQRIREGDQVRAVDVKEPEASPPAAAAAAAPMRASMAR